LDLRYRHRARMLASVFEVRAERGGEERLPEEVDGAE
jgi:hypothetical protein